MQHSYEELLSEIRALKEENIKWREENIRLKEEILRLKEQLHLNSKNSSKPPSTDKKGSSTPHKKGGARPGHPGHFRPLFSAQQVHQKVILRAKNCPKCGSLVKPTNEPPSIHQQVEIPEVCFHVTEYERHEFYCPCCRAYGVAPLPLEVGASAFGTRLTAFMSFLSGACRLGKRMVLRVLEEGLGIKAAVGSVSNIERRVSLALKTPYEEVEKEVRLSKDTKHIDETSWRRWGQAECLWVMSTNKAALFKIQNNRNALCRDALLGEAKWTKAAFVTDRLALYRFESGHQYCLAHLKRDLKRFAERTDLDGQWGNVMLDYLDKLFELWKEFRKKQRSRRSLKHGSKRYRDEFVYGLLIAAKKNRHSPSLSRFARSLVRQAKKLFVFIELEGVEPTNNQAERDLRHSVIWRKICHGTKSDRGDRFVERIQSIIGTLARQRLPYLKFLSNAVDSMKRGLPAPVLLQQAC
jgi:transposase